MARTTPKFNKSTGLFGMGGGRRKGAKSKIRQWLDDKKKSKKIKKGIKSRKKSVKDVYKYSKKDSIKLYKDQGMSRKEAKEQTMKDAQATRKRQVKEYTQKVAANKLAKQKKWEADQAAKRAAAPKNSGGSGLPSQQEAAESTAKMKNFREASKRDDLNRERREKNRAAEKEAKGGFYQKTGSDGKTRTVISRNKGESDQAWEARKTKARAEYKKNNPQAQDGAKVGDPKKKKSVVTVDQDLKDLGNALKEGVKMITIPGYGVMKLSQYLTKRKKGMSRAEIGKALKKASAEGVTESIPERAADTGEPEPKKLGMKKSMVQKGKLMKDTKNPTMKRTMTKLVKKKEKKITLPTKKIKKIDAPKEVSLKGRKKTAKHGGALAIMIAPVKTKTKTKKMKVVKKAKDGSSFSDKARQFGHKADEAVRDLPNKIGRGVSRARKWLGFENGGYVKAIKKGAKAQNGGKLTGPKKKNGKNKMKDLNLSDLVHRPSKNKDGGWMMLTSNPPKYQNMKTKEIISESEYYKRTGKKKPKGGFKPAGKLMKNGGKVSDPKKKVVPKDKTGNKNFRSDAVSSYLKGLDKNSKEYKETVDYMNRMGIGQMKNGGKISKTKREVWSKKRPTDPNINPKTGLYFRNPGGAAGNKLTKGKRVRK